MLFNLADFFPTVHSHMLSGGIVSTYVPFSKIVLPLGGVLFFSPHNH